MPLTAAVANPPPRRRCRFRFGGQPLPRIPSVSPKLARRPDRKLWAADQRLLPSVWQPCVRLNEVHYRESCTWQERTRDALSHASHLQWQVHQAQVTLTMGSASDLTMDDGRQRFLHPGEPNRPWSIVIGKMTDREVTSVQRAFHPASAGITAPLMKRASSEARKSASVAMSCGSSMAGMRAPKAPARA